MIGYDSSISVRVKGMRGAGGKAGAGVLYTIVRNEKGRFREKSSEQSGGHEFRGSAGGVRGGIYQDENSRTITGDAGGGAAAGGFAAGSNGCRGGDYGCAGAFGSAGGSVPCGGKLQQAGQTAIDGFRGDSAGEG